MVRRRRKKNKTSRQSSSKFPVVFFFYFLKIFQWNGMNENFFGVSNCYAFDLIDALIFSFINKFYGGIFFYYSMCFIFDVWWSFDLLSVLSSSTAVIIQYAVAATILLVCVSQRVWNSFGVCTISLSLFWSTFYVCKSIWRQRYIYYIIFSIGLSNGYGFNVGCLFCWGHLLLHARSFAHFAFKRAQCFSLAQARTWKLEK